MLKDLTFEITVDEETAIKDITERYSYVATHAIPLCMIFFLSDLSMGSYFEILLSSTSFILMGLYIYMIINQTSATEEKTFILDMSRHYFFKIILEIVLCNKIILSRPSNELSLNDFNFYYTASFYYSLVFEINILHSIGFNLIKSLILLIKYADTTVESSFINNLVSGNFSPNIFLAIFMTSWATFLEYFIKKAVRELWALYDSFKRSYFTMKKCLMNDHPIPSIIVTNKRPNFLILYKNTQAQELFSKITVLKTREVTESHFKKSQNFIKKEIKSSPKSNNDIVNLEDIFTNEMETSFCTEIEKCIFSRKKFFDFPLKIIEKSPKWVVKQVDGKQTFFKGDLTKYEWYRVIVSPCNWKNQEAFFIQLVKNDGFHANEFITGYLSNINEQMNLLVENSEIVCNKVVEYEYERSKDKNYNDQKFLKNSIDGMIFKSSPRNPEVPQKKTPESQLQSGSNKIKAPSIKKVISVNPGINIKSNAIFPFPNFDHSLWLFFKYNTNFLYDMNLTVQLYYSFINKKIFPSTDKVKIKDFLNYLIDYFYLVAKVKNFKFVVKNLSNEEIIVSYFYFRTILFNILLFILNNSNSNEEKIVELHIKNERNFESKQDMFNFHFEIKYYDSKIKINYNTIREILSIENSHNHIDIDKDIAKIKCIDLGMVLINYILKYVYDNNLLFVSYSGNHSISFYMKGYLYKSSYIKLPSFGSSYSAVNLKEPRSRIFEQYQNKILQKVYKINPPVVVKIEDVREKLWKLENRELKKAFTFKTSKYFDPEEIEETYDPKEDQNETIENDNNLVKEINISLFKHLKEHEKLIKKNTDKNVREIMEKLHEEGIKRKFIKRSTKFSTKSNVQIKWDSNMTNIVRFFYPPRILIVEDTSLGRVALIGILRSYKLNVLIDIAACGYEAIQKYKFFLGKGFIYDVIFMDYNLPDMLGSDATQVIRDYEVEYSLIKTNICAVSVDPERVVMKDHLFDGYIEKPVRNEQFYDYITNIIGKSRTDIKLSQTNLITE